MKPLIPDEPFLKPASKVVATDHLLTVWWPDGRTLSVPLGWYPRLVHGTAAERGNVEIDDYGIYWPDLDDGISYKAMLLGRKSGESRASLTRWLAYRARGETVPVPHLPLPPKFAKSLRRADGIQRRSTAKRAAAHRSSSILKRRTA